MKLKYALLCVITLVAMAGVLSITEPTQGEKRETVSTGSADGFVYTVKEYDGMVAVFGYGSAQPLEVLDCPVNSLPDEEIELLVAGIDVKTEEQLQNLIEAYD